MWNWIEFWLAKALADLLIVLGILLIAGIIFAIYAAIQVWRNRERKDDSL